jgi:hypothetical protein
MLEAASTASTASIVKHDAPMLEAESPEGADEKAEGDSRSGSRRRRKRGGRGNEKSVEHIESAAEEEHNKPSEAATHAAPLTGTLILPTGEKPAAEPEKPKEAKPKKLAPGEVYVDDSGNVMIGE